MRSPPLCRSISLLSRSESSGFLWEWRPPLSCQAHPAWEQGQSVGRRIQRKNTVSVFADQPPKLQISDTFFQCGGRSFSFLFSVFFAFFFWIFYTHQLNRKAKSVLTELCLALVVESCQVTDETLHSVRDYILSARVQGFIRIGYS